MTTATMARSTVRGGFVITPSGGSAQSLSFQFNPASLRRRLEPRLSGGEPQSSAGPILYTGAPVETIDLEIELDAGDQETSASSAASTTGIQSQLAALEVILYPSTQQVNQKQALLQAGTLEIGPYLAPTVIFTWGAQRLIPVKVTSCQITEEAFDSQLVPIRARIAVTLQVLSYSDIPPSDPAYHFFMTYQANKESQASTGYTQRSG